MNNKLVNFLNKVPVELLYKILNDMSPAAIIVAYSEVERVRSVLSSYDVIKGVLRLPLAFKLIESLEREELELPRIQYFQESDFSMNSEIAELVLGAMDDTSSSVTEAKSKFLYDALITSLYEIFDYNDEIETYMHSPEIQESRQNIILDMIILGATIEDLRDIPGAEDVNYKFEEFAEKVYNILFAQFGTEAKEKIIWFKAWSSDLDVYGFKTVKMFKKAFKKYLDSKDPSRS